MINKKRLALVTGICGGIGQSIATSILASGAEVVVTDLPGDHFDTVVSEFGFNSFAADLGNEKSVETLNQNIRQNFGDVDILVTAAGGVCGQTGQSIFDVSEVDWRNVLSANLDSAFFLAKHFAPIMSAKGWGRIVTISSGAGLKPSMTGIQAYTAAKHGLIGLTKQLSVEFAPRGITVNSVAPGFVLSNPSTMQQWQGYGEEGQKRLLDRIHTRRLGHPEDIAAAACFLVSDAAGWITGQVLSVDGGTY